MSKDLGLKALESINHILDLNPTNQKPHKSLDFQDSFLSHNILLIFKNKNKTLQTGLKDELASMFQKVNQLKIHVNTRSK